jgi:hypothetical protein
LKQERVIGAVDDAWREPCRAARLFERRGELGAGEAGDPSGVCEGLEGDRAANSSLLRQHEEERLADEQMLFEPADGGAGHLLVAFRDEQIELARTQ